MLFVAHFVSPLFVFIHGFRRSYLMSLVTRHPSPFIYSTSSLNHPASSRCSSLITHRSWCLFFSCQLSPVSKVLLFFRYLRSQKIIICTLYNQNAESLRLITQLKYDRARWCVYACVYAYIPINTFCLCIVANLKTVVLLVSGIF